MKTLVALLVVAAASSAQADSIDRLSEAAMHANAGRHPQAIAIYEQLYRAEQDHTLLPIIAFEYRRAGAQLEAVQHFCSYLLIEPNGEHALFATRQVIEVRKELGEHVDPVRVCGPVPQRVDFAPTKQRSRPRAKMAALGSAAIGVASTSAALYFGFKAKGLSDQIASHDPSQPWPSNIQAIEDRGQSYERKELVFAGIGAAAFVTAGVLWLTGRETETTIAPTFSSSGGGVTLARGF